LSLEVERGGGAMIVVRFKVQCQPERTDEVMAAMRNVVAPSRALPGVIHFDVARDVTDANVLIATEVFEDRAAMENQELQPEVTKVVELIEAGALATPPEWTIYNVASEESPEL
jgi:quinol monooxygenase YgiN